GATPLWPSVKDPLGHGKCRGLIVPYLLFASDVQRQTSDPQSVRRQTTPKQPANFQPMSNQPMTPKSTLRIGIGGPVGSGKTALVKTLCERLQDSYNIAVITNDMYTREDMEFLQRHQALPLERIIGVETGGCPHTAIREDASMNLAAVDDLMVRFPDLDFIMVESGGDNLAATFSPELSDLTLYVIDVSAGDKIPRKGGPGITK